MPTYTYSCEQGHDFDAVVPIAEFESSQRIPCPAHDAMGERQFSPPLPSNICITARFRAVLNAPMWSEVFDVSERELARMPGVEKFSVMASQPGVGNTVSQPGPDLKRKIRRLRNDVESGNAG